MFADAALSIAVSAVRYLLVALKNVLTVPPALPASMLWVGVPIPSIAVIYVLGALDGWWPLIEIGAVLEFGTFLAKKLSNIEALPDFIERINTRSNGRALKLDGAAITAAVSYLFAVMAINTILQLGSTFWSRVDLHLFEHRIKEILHLKLDHYLILSFGGFCLILYGLLTDFVPRLPIKDAAIGRHFAIYICGMALTQYFLGICTSLALLKFLKFRILR